MAKRINGHTIDEVDITRYLAGEMKPDEAIAFHDWLDVPENNALFKQYRSVWDQLQETSQSEVISEERWRNMQEILSNNSESANRNNKRKKWWPVTVAAASLALLCMFGWYYYASTGNKVISCTIMPAENEHVLLPDSSNVLVVGGSIFQYDSILQGGKLQWSEGRTRAVDLKKGEAFFKVKKGRSPFTVHTEMADVIVVGTAFNVVAADDHVAVNVQSGKVMLCTPTDSVLLIPGQKGIIYESTGTIEQQKTEDKNTFSYVTNTFYFQDRCLGEVIPYLEKAYNCEIHLADDDIKNCKLTASFEQLSAQKVLTLISETLGLSLSTNEGAYILEGEGCL